MSLSKTHHQISGFSPPMEPFTRRLLACLCRITDKKNGGPEQPPKEKHFDLIVRRSQDHEHRAAVLGPHGRR